MRRLLTGLLALLMFAGAPAWAQPAAGQGYSQDELDQLLAPIALYPDELLSQILIAATYPLEVVEASRFVQQNPGLQGEALDQALAERSWDPSVQSLAAFPQVLAMMDDRLEWTQRLGDAFLVDQQRVMDTVQSLRQKAWNAGNLQSTPQQAVSAQGSVIIIEPAQPDVVYVPVYDPLVIYGPWWAPGYPPWFWYPPPIYGYPSGVVITAGIYFGAAWGISHQHWGWARPDWHAHHIVVDGTGNRFWSRPGRPPPPGGTWHHEPGHRRGVAYPDATTQDRYRRPDPGAVRARQDYRGYDRAQPAPPPARPVPNAMRPVPGATPQVQQVPQVTRPRPAPSAPAFDPGRSRQQTQTNALRGQQSRQSAGPAPSAGGHTFSRPPSQAPSPAPAPSRAPAPRGGTPKR